jgi:HD-GYP domain-containing protein (c-di-GMP phosphodiesterase class II)
MAVELAGYFGFDEEELKRLRRGAMLHDIGKIGLPDSILLKPGPLAARIFAVVDVFDALSSDRPYRSALPGETVLSMIERDAGSHFDPVVVAAFLDFMRSAPLARGESAMHNHN